MLDTKVDAFLKVPVSDYLMNDNTDGRWCDIVDDPSASNRKRWGVRNLHQLKK